MDKEKLKVIIIDDEKDIRSILVESINESPNMIVIDEADSLNNGYDSIVNNKADAVFMDVKLIGGDAFQILNRLKLNKKNIPPIIINTGFNDFEIAQRVHNEFNDEVIMILKKPFWVNWTNKENEIVKRIFNHKKKNLKKLLLQNSIKIRNNNISKLVRFKDIVLIESDIATKGERENTIFCFDSKYSIKKSLKLLDQELPDNFVRVSRFAIINIDYLDSFDHLDQTIKLKGLGDKFVGLGYSYRSNFIKLIV